jgi:hypothetical protein
VGEDENVLHGRSGDEGESANPAHSRVTGELPQRLSAPVANLSEKLKSALNNNETPAEQVGVISLPKTRRKQKAVNPNQLTLFSDEYEDEYKPDSVKTEPQTTTQAVIIPQSAVDNILSHGGNDKDSLIRIIAHFQKGKTAIENAVFLREEFAGRRNGDVLGRGHIVDGSKYAVWFGADGIKIGRGDSVNTSQSVTISWEQATERISELLEQGTFATQENLDKAWEHEIKDCADKMWTLDQNCDEDVEWLPRDFKRSSAPDDTAEFAELITNDPTFLQEAIDTLEVLCERYEKDRDILRFHYYNPNKLLGNLYDLQKSPTLFTADPAFELQSELFITQDEKNQLVLPSRRNTARGTL